MNLQGNPVGPAVMLVAAMSTTGCGWILGLDEFTDQPPPSPDGGVPVECTSPEDCPAGQHGTAACEAGTCTFSCEVGFANCDDAVGCETSISADKNNCGGCGLKCSAYCVGLGLLSVERRRRGLTRGLHVPYLAAAGSDAVGRWHAADVEHIALQMES